MFIPFFTILEFISYFGWIKVAESLLNPFGDDDEDFQINYLIDRNFQVSYLIVDEAMNQLEMKPDPYLFQDGDIPPSALPYPEDLEAPTCYKKQKLGCYKCLRKFKLVRKVTGSIQYRRAYRCQSTRSRLRSLNENRSAKVPDKNVVNRRVHKVSEMSVFAEDEIRPTTSSLKKAFSSTRAISSSSKKEVQFDFSTKSFNEDTDVFVI